MSMIIIYDDSDPAQLSTPAAISPQRSPHQSPRLSGMGVGQAGFLQMSPSQRASVLLKLPVPARRYNYETIDHMYIVWCNVTCILV